MSNLFKRKKQLPAERLLIIRENAGGDQRKHDYYHKVINRYQKLVLRAYVWRRQNKWLNIARIVFPFIKSLR